jgi:hypothetical protein
LGVTAIPAAAEIAVSFILRFMDKERIKARRELRNAFLANLYDRVDGSVSEFVDGHEIAIQLGADEEEAKRILAYFEERGLLKIDDHKTGIVRITADGVDVVEKEIV